MKRTNIFLKGLAVVSMIALSVNTSGAHSSHDHSNLSLKWNFSDAAKIKVMAKMASGDWQGSVGLSRLDQKILQKYDIRVGNTFNTTLNGKLLKVKRTTLGLKAIKVEGFKDTSYIPEIPVRNSNSVSKVSTASAHAGHDHKTLNKEWKFPSKTEMTIAQRIKDGSYPVLVGLASIDRKAMEAYGIKIGNKFRARVAGQDLVVTRFSSGVKIERSSSLEVASLSQAEAM